MKITYPENDISNIVKVHLIPLFQKYSLFTFDGAIGAGKTTLIKELLVQSGVKELITSPTFAYVNTYATNDYVFHHFDLYRINSLDSFIMSGFDEYLYKENAICLIEWPGVITELITTPLLHKKHCHISLTHHPLDTLLRTLEIQSLAP